MSVQSKPELLLELADQIELEMKTLGLWRAAEAPDTTPKRAYGADSMTFEEWLESVFLRNLRRAALTGTLPKSSNVATAAVRNLDGVVGSDKLIDLLARVDRLVDQS